MEGLQVIFGKTGNSTRILSMGNLIDKPYDERTLEEKIQSNWKKTLGLMKRGEFSTVIIRAATTVELAANLLVKYEFELQRQLPSHFVENLMMWANGLMGKVDRLLIPIFKDTANEEVLKQIKVRSKDINDERNNVVHRGQFKNHKTAKKVLEEAAFIINKFAELSGSQLRVDSTIEDEEVDDS
jgi:hypothetical protein